MRKYIIAILIAVAISGCIKEQDVADNYKQRLVVEGRIENGRAAVVVLSLNIGIQDEYSNENLSDMIVRWAKVTIVDDEGNEEILTGRLHKDYPTKYIYTGLDVVGEVGRSYRLVVEYSGRKWEAITTIPRPIMLEDITIEHYQDSLYAISAVIPPSPTPCSIDCSLNGSAYYAPTLLGVYNASAEYRHITINSPLVNLERHDYVAYFKSKESVRLRVNALDDFSYYYWREWENSVINSVNPVFPSTCNMPTNISNKGIGIWSGYGTAYYDIGVMPNP